MAARAAAAQQAALEQAELDRYIQRNRVEKAVQEVVQSLLAAKPDNPRQWLLDSLEKEMSTESEDLSESDLHRLFAVTRKITSEIMPQETIDLVISETLKLVSCDRVSLFVFDKKMNMLRLYASNLATPIMVSPGQGIVGSVFNHRQTVNIPDCYMDHRFDKSFDLKTGYSTKSLIAMPIVDFEGCVNGVIQAINKIPDDDNREGLDGSTMRSRAVAFERSDEKVLLHLTQHVCIAMRNAELYREAISTSERSMGLLNTIQSLSQDLGTQSLLLTITMHATKIVSSVRATVFLVDEPNQQLWSVSTDTGAEIRIPKKAGIAGQCCCEGRVINIPDAYADSRFNQEIDKRTGFKTQSILAIPMIDEEVVKQAASTPSTAQRKSLVTGEMMQAASKPNKSENGVIGIIQMINKVSYDGQLEVFDEADIQVMELFAKFVGPKLAHSSMMSKKASDQTPEKKEAEMALGNMKEESDRGDRARKRMSSAAMVTLEEDAEDEGEGETKSAYQPRVSIGGGQPPAFPSN